MKKLIFTFVLIVVFVGIKAQTNYEHIARIIINELNLSVAIGPVYRAEQGAYLIGAKVPSSIDYPSLKRRINGLLDKYNDIRIVRPWEWNSSQSYSLMISKESIKHQVTLYISYFPDEQRLVFMYK